MSDAIFVVNVDNYIGESTYSEIDWANRMKKQIFFLVEPPKPENSTPDVEPVVNSNEDAAE